MTLEQMTAPGAEQATEPEEQLTAVAPVADPVATTETRTVADFDLSTPEGVRKAAEMYPAFRAVFADERNAEKQRTLNEMRRERGTSQSVQEYHKRVIDRLRNGDDPDEVAKETPLYASANQELARVEMFKNLYEKAKELDPDSVSALDGFADQEDLTSDHWQGLAQAAMNAVANSSAKSAKHEAYQTESLDDIPKDSPLWRAIDTHITKEREAEMTAEQITASQKPNPPATPSGAIVAGGKTATEIAAMTKAQLDTFTDTLSEEEWGKVMTTMYEAARQ